MIEYLSGELTRKSPTEVVVECGGVGYAVQVSLNTYAALPRGRDGAAVRLLIHPHYGENVQRLYGFHAEQERALFRLLQSVRGVGPSLALALLSHEPVDSLLHRLRAGDITGLTRVKGVGRKTAERLMVELRDRLPEVTGTTLDPSAPASDRQQMLVQALASLGLTPSESEERARRVLDQAPADARIEELLRRALHQGARAAGP